MTRVTLQTIADKVGVSRMTVSNAFSRPDQLSAALRERILAAAAELGYVGPDPAARALARGSAGTVGVLLTESLTYAFTDEVTTGFLAAITEELAASGLALTLLSSDASGPRIPARDVAMDGAIVYSCNPDTQAVDWLRKRGLPLVHVDQPPVVDAPAVNVADREGARAAAQHLVDLGHRRVAVLTIGRQGPYAVPVPVEAAMQFHATAERMRGWLDALRPAGIEPVVVLQPHNVDGDARCAAAAVLDRADRPTGVLCFSDVMAQEVVRVAADRGLRVPGDVSVVGFDDSPLARRVRPALTTVRQDVTAKGRTAAALLIAAIEASRAGDPQPTEQILLPTEVVVRDSTGPAGYRAPHN